MADTKKFAVSVTLQGAVEFRYTITAENLELATREAEDKAFDSVHPLRMNEILTASSKAERIDDGKTRKV